MSTIPEQIKELEDELTRTPKNKATESHVGRIKAKLAKLKNEQEKQRAASGGVGKTFAVKKSGNATVGLVVAERGQKHAHEQAHGDRERDRVDADGEGNHDFEDIEGTWDLEWLVWAGGTANVIYEQTFTVYWREYYWEHAPEGASALPDL